MKQSGENQVASRYVSALFDAAKAASAVPMVEKDMAALAALQDAGALGDLVNNPLLTRAEQAKTIEAVSKKLGFGALTNAFLLVLASQRRLNLLSAIGKQFSARATEERGEISADIISAAPMSAAELKDVADRLSKALGKKVNLTASQDANLLGGAVITLGSLRLDASLAGKLSRIEQTLKAA